MDDDELDRREPVVAAMLERLGVEHPDAHAASIVEAIDRVPVPKAKLHQGTLARARETLHVHRWDMDHGKVGGPDSYYRGITMATALLRQELGAQDVPELVNCRRKIEELTEHLMWQTAQSTEADYVYPSWLLPRLRHALDQPNIGYQFSDVPLTPKEPDHG